MSRIKMWGLAIVAGWLMSAGVGWSADAPATGTAKKLIESVSTHASR